MRKNFTYDEEKLITLMRSSCEHAFQLIYDKRHSRIYNVSMRYLNSPVAAQDVVQDVFVKLWEKRDRIDPLMPIEAWLYTVTKFLVLKRLRKQAHNLKALNYLKINNNFQDNSLVNGLADTDYATMLEAVLKSLSERQQKVYRLSREENFSYLQIAESLNISPLTVKTHMSRALFSIRALLSIY